jgi:cytochrome c peroxidase
MQTNAQSVRFKRHSLAIAPAVWLFAATCGSVEAQAPKTLPQAMIPARASFANINGTGESFSSIGPEDPNSPFFQSLGTNGRSCSSCHQPDQGWGISAAGTLQRFVLSNGTDPVFRPVDGANCGTDRHNDFTTIDGRSQAYSLLLTRALIRVGIAVPAGAEFQVISVNNPYGCNDNKTLSMYRRPLPTTNLRFLTTVMWDGRESFAPTTQKISFATNPGDLLADLTQQASDAVSIHAEGTVPLTAAQQQGIVAFETGLHTAQTVDMKAGKLTAGGATAGPLSLAAQQFFVGINDPIGNNPFNTPFNSAIFNLFDKWATEPFNSAKAAVYRGQVVFNTKNININNVAGLNDTLNQPVIAGFCGTCHSAPNAGNHSVPLPINIGVGDLTSPLDISYLPVFNLRNNATGATIQTTDPGRALVAGKWADVGKFKGPVLRGLSARAPYFHNGSARSLNDVVDFYDSRFNVGFTDQEKNDLIAFLKTL